MCVGGVGGGGHRVAGPCHPSRRCMFTEKKIFSRDVYLPADPNIVLDYLV